MQELLKVLYIFSMCATMGWILEFFFRSTVHKKIINPGFLTGMALPIYGFGGVLLYLLSNCCLSYHGIIKVLIIFISTGLGMTILEFISGYIFLKVFKVKLWDYSKMKNNIMGLICPIFTIAWGLLSCVYIFFIQDYIINIVNLIDGNIYGIIFLSVYYSLFAIYLLVSFNILSRMRDLAKELKIVIVIETVLNDILNKIDKKGFIKRMILFLEPKILIDKNIFKLLKGDKRGK